jgi:four helix bundle suffix protein
MAERPPNSKVFGKSGGYEKLKSYQVAELLYDVTVRFCDRYIDLKSRTHDQMVQAARSGSRNIAEGSVFSATSKKIEMNLTNVARASLAELKGDYESFLRQRGLPLWEEADPRRKALITRRCKTAAEVALWVKELWLQEQAARTTAHGPDGPDGPASDQAVSIPSIGSTRARAYQELSANAAHVLCGVAMALLDRQLQSLGREFEKNGGFNERLYKVRTETRKQLPGKDGGK